MNTYRHYTEVNKSVYNTTNIYTFYICVYECMFTVILLRQIWLEGEMNLRGNCYSTRKDPALRQETQHTDQIGQWLYRALGVIELPL